MAWRQQYYSLMDHHWDSYFSQSPSTRAKEATVHSSQWNVNIITSEKHLFFNPVWHIGFFWGLVASIESLLCKDIPKFQKVVHKGGMGDGVGRQRREKKVSLARTH